MPQYSLLSDRKLGKRSVFSPGAEFLASTKAVKPSGFAEKPGGHCRVALLTSGHDENRMVQFNDGAKKKPSHGGDSAFFLLGNPKVRGLVDLVEFNRAGLK